MPFSTSYHTRFPEYVSARFPVPVRFLHSFVRWFHNAGNGCMVATASLERELSKLGVHNLLRWSRGIDQTVFHPMERTERPFDLPRPIFMTVGRVAVEKNLPAFLDLDLPGSKVVVGDGPARADLQARYPNVLFTGMKTGADLARAYAQADVFVFPSKTDTFGNTILEALASGVPVAAFPVMGPIDIIEEGSGAAHWMRICRPPASRRSSAAARMQAACPQIHLASRLKPVSHECPDGAVRRKPARERARPEPWTASDRRHGDTGGMMAA